MAKKVSDEALLQALLEHGGVAGAAEAVGMSRNGIYKRLADRGFRASYQAAQSAVLAVAACRLTESVDAAADALRAVLDDPNASPGVKVSAADAILRHCVRYCEVVSLEDRIAELELKAAVSVL